MLGLSSIFSIVYTTRRQLRPTHLQHLGSTNPTLGRKSSFLLYELDV